MINSFRVNRDGKLTAAPGSPYPGQGLGASVANSARSIRASCSSPTLTTVPPLGTASAFDDSWDGTLSSIGASPFADNQTRAVLARISHDGQRLYALKTGTSSVSSYSIAGDGTLTLLASTPLSSPVGAITGTDVTVSTDDSTLYVNEAKNGTVAGVRDQPRRHRDPAAGFGRTQPASAPARRPRASRSRKASSKFGYNRRSPEVGHAAPAPVRSPLRPVRPGGAQPIAGRAASTDAQGGRRAARVATAPLATSRL